MGLSRPFWLPPNHRQGEGPITMTVTDQLERTKKFVPIFKQVNVTFNHEKLQNTFACAIRYMVFL